MPAQDIQKTSSAQSATIFDTMLPSMSRSTDGSVDMHGHVEVHKRSMWRQKPMRCHAMLGCRQPVEVQGRSAGSGRTSRRALSRRIVVVAPQGRIEAVVARTRGARHVQPPLRGKRTSLVRAEARRSGGRRGAQDRLLVVEECQRAPRWARGRR